MAIARVLLKNAPILVLDEATSALDSEAEAAIQDNLGQLMQGKTVIAIAHRLSTISEMDRIVVLDKGQIVEQGPPAELLARDGLYARLWKRQTGGFIPRSRRRFDGCLSESSVYPSLPCPYVQQTMGEMVGRPSASNAG